LIGVLLALRTAGNLRLVIQSPAVAGVLWSLCPPCRITPVPDPVCWEAVPEAMNALKNRHVRRQRGLAESLEMNRQLFFSRKGGAAGGVAFPFVMLFEWRGPLFELLGYVVMTALWLYPDQKKGDMATSLIPAI